MTNRSIRMAAVAIALLALTGCNLPFMNKATSMIKEKAGNAATEIANQLNKDEQAQPANEEAQPSENETLPEEGMVANSTNLAECQKGCAILNGTGMFSKEFCQDSCWAAVAEDTGDVTICDSKISQDNGLVLFSCYMNVAKKNKDAKFCDKIGKDSTDLMRAGCYSEVAKEVKDPAVCEGIKGNMLYDSCVTDAKGE